MSQICVEKENEESREEKWVAVCGSAACCLRRAYSGEAGLRLSPGRVGRLGWEQPSTSLTISKGGTLSGSGHACGWRRLWHCE